ncbi:hypothetical protein QFC21_004032 [Naganishia friedmannii]|uniref:Uncharacterized protein n=1 Tax=Naganishia friedmannii TaxID=89922 RepID=A0ACC2VJ98_9TREE|nr:hypothetical protein QFC21_004032 [Naganishia friedmannii]
MTPAIDKAMNDLQQSLDEIKLTATAAQKEDEIKLNANPVKKKKSKKAKAKQKPAEQSPSKNTRPATTLLNLPPTLIVHIASMVRHQSLRSLANLNECSEAIYQTTLPVFWTEVHWTSRMWKDLPSRGGGLPPGLEFIEYIHFSGKTPWFWEGLTEILSPEVAALGSQDVVWGLFPNLIAVIRTELRGGVEIPKSIWLTVHGASLKQTPMEESPITKIIRMTYQAWHLSCGIVPTFSTSYQSGCEENLDKYISSHDGFWEGTHRPDHERSTRASTTPLRKFVSGPDASLEVDACRHTVKRTLDFHVLFEVEKHYFAPVKLRFLVNGVSVFPDVKIWLKIAQLASEHDLGGKVSPPFSLSATLNMPHTTLGLVAESCVLQRELLAKLEEYTANADDNISSKLPRTVRIKTNGDPARQSPSCKHADIDLRDAETAKVVLITQCYPGGSDQKGCLNGRPMAPRDFERWRKRVKPDFSIHN